MLRLCRKHFSTLLQGDHVTNTAFRDVVPKPSDGDGVKISRLAMKSSKSRLCVLKAIKRQVLMASSSPSPSPSPFKTGYDMLVGRMYQLIFKIWLEESVSNNWNLCPILKMRSLSHIKFLQAYCMNDWSHSSKHWLDLNSATSNLASPHQILGRTH